MLIPLFHSVDKTIANCNIPEKPIPDDINEDLIENSYNAGSIVWAHIRGYPWWPGIVSDCPMTFQYYKLHKTSLRPVSFKFLLTYNVIPAILFKYISYKVAMCTLFLDTVLRYIL